MNTLMPVIFRTEVASSVAGSGIFASGLRGGSSCISHRFKSCIFASRWPGGGSYE